MKSILMFAAHFPPASTAGVHRTLRFVKYMQQFDCLPTVVTRSIRPEPGGLELEKQIPSDVAVIRTGDLSERDEKFSVPHPTASSSNRSVLGRSIKSLGKKLILPPVEFFTETPDQYVSWVRQASTAGKNLIAKNSYDVLYTTGPPHSSHLIGMRLARQCGIPWIADFRDPWSRFNWPKSRNPWGRRLQPWYEHRVVRSATRVILNNETSCSDFQKTYPEQPAEKFCAIANGFDPDLKSLVDRVDQNGLSRGTMHSSSTSPVICHPGTLYRQRTPRVILEAIRRLRDQGREVRFLQIGSFSEECSPMKIGEELGIEDLVLCIPRLPHEETLAEMAQADILLAIQPNAPLQVPGKLYEMLLFDKPILAVCDSEATSQVINTAGLAKSVASDDSVGIVIAVSDFLEPNNQRELVKRNEARSRYDGRQLTSLLSAVVHEIASK